MDDQVVDIREEIIIDRNALEEECSSAPAFFDFWQSRESDLKVEKENYEANIGRKIRNATDSELKTSFGLSKLTEGAINDTIKSDPSYQEIKRKLAHAESSRKAYEHKMHMLDILARLHGQGYFSKIENKQATRSLIAESIKKKISEEIKARSSEKPKRPKK